MYLAGLESHLNFEMELRSSSFIHFSPLDIGIPRLSIQWFPANSASIVLVNKMVLHMYTDYFFHFKSFEVFPILS